MANNTKSKGLLQTEDSKKETSKEQPRKQKDTILSVNNSSQELSPFQRAKRGSYCFLAAEVIPIRKTVN